MISWNAGLRRNWMILNRAPAKMALKLTNASLLR